MQNQGLWKFILAGIAFLGIASAAGGYVFAQGGDSTETPPAATEEPADGGSTAVDKVDFTARLAETLGISEDELRQAVMDTEGKIVDEWLAGGRIDEEQAAELKSRIEEKNGDLHAIGPRFGHGPGKGGHFGFGGGEELAGFLGITVEELAAARMDEQSLAQIAEANGVTRDALIDFLVGQMEEKLNEKVTEERIDQARADQILQNFRDNIDELIDRTDAGPRFDGPRHHGPGRFGDFTPGDMPAETTDTAAISPLVY